MNWWGPWMKGMFYALSVYNIKAKALHQERVKHRFLFLWPLWGIQRIREFCLKTDAAVWFTTAADWAASIHLNPWSGVVFKPRWNPHLFRKALSHIPTGQYHSSAVDCSGIWVFVASPFWNRDVTQSRTWRLIFHGRWQDCVAFISVWTNSEFERFS